MKTGATDGKIGLVWYWVEDPEWQPLHIRHERKSWCRDHFGILWQCDITKWYFANEKDRMLFMLTWL